MSRLKRLRHLKHDVEDLIQRNRATRQPLGERFARHELENEKMNAVGLFESVKGRDVRVVQRGQDS